MALLEQWRKMAYETQMSTQQSNYFWGNYFNLEKGIYEKLLAAPDEVVSGTVKELAEKYDGKVKIGKCNIDDEDGLARMYRVMNIPNMKIFVKGEPVGNIVGAVPQEELEAELAKVL